MAIVLSSMSERFLWTATEWDASPRRGSGWGMTTTSASLPPPPPDDRQQIDAALLQRVARGDKQALADLYDRFSGPLYGTALRIVRDPTEAQDVVHDAFVTLWEKAATFETNRGTAFSWAVTLVRNRAIDRVRMRRRRAELLAESVPSDLGYNEGDQGPPGADSAAVGDDARAVRAAVAKLPVEQQRALELAFFGGLTQEEIARKLSEPLGTVKARIRRGLLKLRDSLAQRL
jgi:RNA polymerase sigma-70 factor, ECF subfamily